MDAVYRPQKNYVFSHPSRSDLPHWSSQETKFKLKSAPSHSHAFGKIALGVFAECRATLLLRRCIAASWNAQRSGCERRCGSGCCVEWSALLFKAVTMLRVAVIGVQLPGVATHRVVNAQCFPGYGVGAMGPKRATRATLLQASKPPLKAPSDPHCSLSEAP